MKDNIDIPTLNLDDVESIVNSGVRKKVSFIKYLKDVFRELGFRNIFHDKNELFFIIAITFVILGFSTFSLMERNVKEVYKIIFIISPILYLVISIFSFYNSKEKGAFEIEMTCKYNLYQLSAVRMFIFSVLTALFNTILILMVGIFNNEINITRLICISITGLFLFSAVFLYSLITFKSRVIKALVIGGWLFINTFLSKVNSGFYTEFLIKAPIYIHLAITVACIFLYIKSLNNLVNFRRQKGEI